MYYSHFGLNKPPFRITPNTEFFYSGGNRGPILEALIYAISQGEGIIKVTGEVGSGKTMLCNMLQSRLPSNIETVYIVNPSVSPEEILQAIAVELQLNPPRDSGHLQTMQLLHQHLLDRHAHHKRVVMFVEEAQSMPIATLEEIRLLSNLETPNSKLLQIVLFGQPEFENNLRQPQIRQLRERITHSFRLAPLKGREVRDYLDFRLRAADYRGPDLFSPAVVKAIAKASGGLTRRINLIADKTLLAAFSDNTHGVRLRHVQAAVRDSEFSNNGTLRVTPRIALPLAFLALGTGLGIVVYPLIAGRPIPDRPTLTTAQPAAPSVVAPPPAPGEASSVTPMIPESKAPRDPQPPAAETPATREEQKTAPVEVASPVVATAPQPSEAPVTELVRPPVKAAPIVSPNPESRTIRGDMLDNRVAATQQWLAAENSDTYSIQLLGAMDAEHLKHHLKGITKYIEINDIFVYRTLAQKRPSLTVLYGSFSDRRAAQEALANLPDQLKVFKPQLRTVKGIRAELAERERT